METKIAIFRGKEIRKTIHKNEWWFVVEDVVLALIDSKDPKQYIQRMKKRDPELGKGWVQIVHTLENLVLERGISQRVGANCHPLWIETVEDRNRVVDTLSTTETKTHRGRK
jgi:hypothetical protein